MVTAAETSRARVLLLIVAAGILALLVLLHTPGLNGPWYWWWPWRRVEPLRWYGGMLLAALPLMAGVWVGMLCRARPATVLAIGLAMTGVIAMKLASRALTEPSLSLTGIGRKVYDPDATSYYTDAVAFAESPHWLALYPAALPMTHLHTQSKPPGPVGYYRLFIRAFGHSRRTAELAGIALAALGTLSIPAVYLLVVTLTRDRDAAIASCLLMALCPGYLYFVTNFDPLYAALGVAMIVTWHHAVRGGIWWAAAFGATLVVVTFMTFNVLPLGMLLAAYPFVLRDGPAGKTLRRIASRAAVALAAAVGLYLLLFAATAYDPVATFFSAWKNQQTLLAAHAEDRPYPATILFDLTDFLLGAAWLPALLSGMGLATLWRRRQTDTLRVALLCLAMPLFLAVTGLVQSETARAWNFLLPLLLLPAGLELATWPLRYRLAALGTMLALTLVIGQNMTLA